MIGWIIKYDNCVDLCFVCFWSVRTNNSNNRRVSARGPLPAELRGPSSPSSTRVKTTYHLSARLSPMLEKEVEEERKSRRRYRFGSPAEELALFRQWYAHLSFSSLCFFFFFVSYPYFRISYSFTFHRANKKEPIIIIIIIIRVGVKIQDETLRPILKLKISKLRILKYWMVSRLNFLSSYLLFFIFFRIYFSNQNVDLKDIKNNI